MNLWAHLCQYFALHIYIYKRVAIWKSHKRERQTVWPCQADCSPTNSKTLDQNLAFLCGWSLVNGGLSDSSKLRVSVWMVTRCQCECGHRINQWCGGLFLSNHDLCIDWFSTTMGVVTESISVVVLRWTELVQLCIGLHRAMADCTVPKWTCIQIFSNTCGIHQIITPTTMLMLIFYVFNRSWRLENST